jgi:hypothetical protein
MARGWEKEHVDAPESKTEQPQTPAVKREADREKQRKLQGLQLQRERILSERTSSPHRRSALEAALLEIEEQLAQLGWSVHI